jgi:hypothetical protein
VCRGRKSIARWTEKIGLRWAITKAAWGGKYPPPTNLEAVSWYTKTPRNQFYDDHLVGVKSTSTTRSNKPEKTNGD